MPKKLLVEIGGDRFTTEIAHVNDPTRPTEIDTDKFVGRVLVRVRDFEGVAPEGFDRIRNDEPYFAGRSRKFAIQLEGRFKAREGSAPYTADEVHFGSDFDHLVDFPRQAFNAGMKVAQWVDPCTFYEEKPPSGRPFIMSPYAACMNTFAAWPAPSRTQDAIVVLRHTEHEDAGAVAHKQADVPPGAEDLVPLELRDDGTGDAHKGGRHLVRYWRFVGFRQDGRVQDWLRAHAPRLLVGENSSRSSSSGGGEESASTSATPSRPGLPHQASLGVLPRSDSPAPMSGYATPQLPADVAGGPTSGGTGTPTTGKHKKGSSGSFGFGALKNALSGVTSGTTTPKVNSADVTTADQLHPAPVGARKAASTKLDNQLGPFKFAGEGADIVEDNTFVFVNTSLPVPKRRKHFSTPAHRQAFTYDPSTVYATSFFTPFCDLNTFDLRIGPVHMNIGQFFTDMPIRYTLRSTRRDDKGEEEVFATVSFRLVDA